MKIKKPSYVLRNFIQYIISELLNSGFLFSFVGFKIFELCNLEVSYLFNVPPTPYRSSKFSFRSNWVQKTSIYEISRMFFSNMDFNFAHFTNFNFTHFEIEESFG